MEKLQYLSTIDWYSFSGSSDDCGASSVGSGFPSTIFVGSLSLGTVFFVGRSLTGVTGVAGAVFTGARFSFAGVGVAFFAAVSPLTLADALRFSAISKTAGTLS